MMGKLFALLALTAVFLSPAHASPTVTNGTLDARQSCGTPGSFCTTTPCCAGFFCSTTTRTCGSCQGPVVPAGFRSAAPVPVLVNLVRTFRAAREPAASLAFVDSQFSSGTPLLTSMQEHQENPPPVISVTFTILATLSSIIRTYSSFFVF
ncbi:hypothetical protein B0H14DRAFT_2575432 [Mycena olivaceomarginata]|nr:hypothetical protein B0H14DRAFT_2575432 [Mycena olivaceomarginata]